MSTIVPVLSIGSGLLPTLLDEMPPTPNTSKNHHYVPQFILRNFANKSGKLYCFNKEEGKIYQSPPRRLFKQDHLNTYRSEDGSESIHLEDSLSKLESDVSRIVRKVCNNVRGGCGISLTPSEHVIWGRFLMTQIARNPKRLESSLEKDPVAKHMRNYEHVYGPVHPEVREHLLAPEEKKRMVQNTYIETVEENDAYSKNAPLLARKNIVALVADKKSQGFVIGNTGVIRLPEAVHYLLHPKTRLLYPISWDIILAWGYPYESEDVISMTCDEVRGNNEQILAQSDIVAGRTKELIESISRIPQRYKRT